MAKLEISRVHDAYAEGGECPLCTLADKTEETLLDSFQHSRIMEPNVRVKTNESGFCARHYRGLYARENKLGLGLVVHTHLRAALPRYRAAFDLLLSGASANRRGGERIEEAAASLAALHESCFICDLLAADMDRFAFTVLYLWEKDPDFLPVFRASRGFCIEHFLSVLAVARKLLRRERLQRWLNDVLPLMRGSLERLEGELLAFTGLYHDQNRSLGTDEERSALRRALQKLAGGHFRAQ